MKAQRPARTDLPTGEVTFLFTDIEGSTRLLVELGDAYEPLLATHAMILRHAIAEHRGVEVNTEGDAFFAAFGSAVDGVAAAIAAQRTLADEAWPDGRPIRVRMGLHTGEGRLGGDDYAGLDVNRAARIAAAAHGGQTLVSAATAARIDGRPADATPRSLGRHRLKDLPDAIELFQLEIDGLPTTFPPPKTLDARLTNLPPDAAAIIGRETEIATVRDLLADHRLVTLTGPGGTGKTRLAMAVGAALVDETADGVVLVEAEDAVDRAGLASAVAATIGIREQPDRDLESSVVAYLADRSVLLLLDNLEQALEAAPLVSDLLAASPGSRAIVTSRTVLRLRDEQEVPVDPLPLPADPAASPHRAASQDRAAARADIASQDRAAARDRAAEPDRSAAPGDIASRDRTAAQGDIATNPAVALFLARARQTRPDLDPTGDDLAAIAAICRRLDGLPLAIELAAARIRMLTPAAILERLDRALPLLKGGDRDRPARQRTLTGAIDWSYDLLDADERRLFAGLSVFAGGWTLEAAEAVCADITGVDVFDGLASLTEKSLVRTEHDADGDPRFGMLTVIGEYAAARAADEPTLADAVGTHAAWVADLVETVRPNLTGRDLGRDQRRLRTEDENIRAALRHAIGEGDAVAAGRIAGSLWRYWHFWGRVREGIDWLLRAADLPQQGVPDSVAASVRTGLGSLRYWIGRMEAAEVDYEAALALRQRGDDAQATADALYDVAWPAAATGRNEEAARRFAAARDAYAAIGDEVGLARVVGDSMTLDLVVNGRGSYEEVVAYVEGALEVFDRHRAHHDWIGALSGLVYSHQAAGRPGIASNAARRTIAAMLDVGDLGRLGDMLKVTARIELELGHAVRAAVLAAATARHAEELGGNLSDSFFDFEIAEPARRALGDGAYATAEARGRAMTIGEAGEFALRP